MKKKALSVFLTLTLVLALFSGCGASSNTTAARPAELMAMDQMVMEEAYEMEAPAAMAGGSNSLKESGSNTTSTLPEGRKWVITVNISAETDDLDAMTVALDSHIQALGGYVEDQQIYNGSTYANRRYRYANLTIRIPAADTDKFTQEIAGIANVVSRETSRDDITLKYVDTESRLNALKVEEARLLELLEQAETMADLLEIEARLTDVRYELENYGSRLRLYDNQVDYATIYLNIEEVQEYTPVAEPTFWERISNGFADSLDGLWESLQDLVVLLVTAFPFLVVYGGIAAILILLVKKVKKWKLPNCKKIRKSKTTDDEKK